MTSLGLGVPVVVSVLSRNPSWFGGCAFTGEEVDGEGRVIDAKTHVVVKAPASLLAGVTVERGPWRWAKRPRERFARSVNGWVLTGTQNHSRPYVASPHAQRRCVSLAAVLRAWQGGTA